MPQLPAGAGRVLLWEQTRPWGRGLLNRLQQAEPAGDFALLIEQAVFVDSVRELAGAVEAHPASFVIAEATGPHLRELLIRLPFWRRNRPLLRVVVACFDLPQKPADEFGVTTTIFREAGAAAVLTTRRELSALTPAIITHFATIPQRKTDWRDDIERKLPWRDV